METLRSWYDALCSSAQKSTNSELQGAESRRRHHFGFVQQTLQQSTDSSDKSNNSELEHKRQKLGLQQLAYASHHYRSRNCVQYAFQNATRAAMLGGVIHAFQAGYQGYSMGVGGTRLLEHMVRPTLMGMYDWSIFVFTASFTNCFMTKSRGTSDVLNSLCSGAAGGAASAVLQWELVIRPTLYSDPAIRSMILQNAKQQALMGGMFLAALHLFTGLL